MLVNKNKIIRKIKKVVGELLPPQKRLFIKMVAITTGLTILLVLWALYRLAAGDFFGFLIGWCSAGAIMFLVLFFVVKPIFKAHLESLPAHTEPWI